MNGMDTRHQKVFRDPVHGYISVPRDLCDRFIDTAIFQRLRNIEQTSMRPLYPSAHHDRFAHSLGVYHLANLAFHHLKRNTDPTLLPGIDLSDYKASFLVAALMHDCGHAPFSHTFEEFYNRGNRAEKLLKELAGPAFSADYDHNYETERKGPAEHEMFSAAVFLKHYAGAFTDLFKAAEPVLVARMITGCIHQGTKKLAEEVENCLILLLNGRAIDVDKLDYILRDTWASGVNNVSVDVHRLLSALELVRFDDHLVPAFNKSALSVVQGVVDGRNYLFNWIYGHHTVCYYNELLTSAVKKLSRLVSPDGKPDRLLDTLFSAEAFEGPVKIKTFSAYLPCDGDIYCFLKHYRKDIPEVDEILSRQPRLVPLWKTQAEFEHIFAKKKGADQRTHIRVRVKEILAPVITDAAARNRIMALSVKPKLATIQENELYVTLRNTVIPFTEASGSPTRKHDENISYFYVFIPRECIDRAEECVKALQAEKTY